MVLQNYQNLIGMTSNIFHIVALGVGVKCPRKIYLNTQWGGGQKEYFEIEFMVLPISSNSTYTFASPLFTENSAMQLLAEKKAEKM